MFRFTIRELVLLTMVAGLALGWWLDHERLDRRNDQILASLEVFLALEPSERPTLDDIMRAAEERLRD
jgi:hypothetical protein